MSACALMSYGGLIAEEEGFEPPVLFPVHRISSAAHSTTLALFHSYLNNLQENFEFIK